jgi:hypothetical protein
MKSGKFGAAALAATLLASSAFADVASTPLPAGKPAGTKQAEFLAASPLLLIGAIALVVVIAVAASSGGGGHTTTTTTGTGG